MNTNTTQPSSGNDFPTLLDFWKSFKKVWWVSAIAAVILGIAAFIIGAVTYTPMYRASVRFTIMPLVDSDSSSGASVYSFNYNEALSTQMAATFPHIINEGFLSEIVSYDIGRPINGTISANAITDTNIFEMHVQSSSAKDAYDIVNSLIENYPKIAEHVVGDTRMNVLVGSEPILPTKPYNSGAYYSTVVLSVFVGIIIGLGVALVRMYTEKTVTGKRDIETEFNGKLLCEIPHVVAKRTNGSNHSLLKPITGISGFSESVRALKARVRSAAESEGLKVIGITSALGNEGKTTISYNLARSLSHGAEKVLLVDMDLEIRAIQEQLNRKGTVPDTGITEVVSGKLALAESINSISDTFDVLFAGTENAKFSKARFAEVFRLLREQYDYIIVDMPSCVTSPESVSIADFCDGIIFTVKYNSTDRRKVSHSINYLAFSDTSIIGYVINDVPINRSKSGGYKHPGRYSYRYGYGYSSRYGYGYGHGQNPDSAAKDKE